MLGRTRGKSTAGRAGSRTVDEIIDELAVVYTADRGEIAGDVTDMLAELVAKRMLVGA